jgi:hypothetical protein
VTRVKDGGKTSTGRQGLDHEGVHVIIDNVTRSLEVDRVDDLVVAVVFVAARVLCLATVTGAGMLALAT